MKPVLYRRLCRTTALIALTVMPVHAYAGPEGGLTTAGSAAISSSGSTTTIHQSTDRAIIRWNSFDVGASESVQFVQPSSSSITVNRIQDTKASQIDGRISANGNIVLLNPNGIVFGATAVVDVNGLVASSSDLDDDHGFMAGGAVKLTRPGNADAAIINRGSITAKQGGLVGLVAPAVENHGVIEAKLGKVALASGDIATIDLAGDGLIKIEVTDAVLAQHVLNAGTINADGGSIILTAAQARGMVDALVSNTGTLQANTVTVENVQKKGEITLSTKGLDMTLPRGNGMVFTTGEIKAEGVESEQAGGMITILSDKINIGYGTYVTAAGDADGGTINIGGAYQGGTGLPTSDMVYVSDYAILNAQSRRRGSGGTIILWSDTNTRFYGHADASGGSEFGDGGLIEVSGKEYLDFNGTVDLSASNGKRGVLLLDPTDITISTGGNNNVTGGSPFTPTVDGGPSVLNVTTLQSALASGDVIVQTRSTGAQAGNITVSNAVTWASGSTLTLDAHNNIVVNAAISGQNLRFVVGNDLQLAANISGTGTLTIEQAGDATTVGIGAGATGTLNLNAADLSRIVNGWSDIIIGKLTGTGAVNMRAVTWSDNLTVRSGTGVITVSGIQTMGSNNLTIQTDADISLGVANALSGSGHLWILQTSVNTSIGLGGAAGTINLTATEVGRIVNGWSSLTFGRTDGTGAVNVAALTWNDFLTLQSGTGVITVSGTQTMNANNLTIITDSDLALNGALSGTSTLSIQQTSAGTTMGIGDGQAGTIAFTNTELGRFTNGWANIVLGRTDGSGDINIGARSWNDSITIQSGSGVINVNGTQTMGANNLTFVTDADINMAASLTGTGALEFVQASDATTIGIGDGQAGTLNFSDAKIGLMTNGWASIGFGRADGTGDLNIGYGSWVDSLILRTGSGALNINTDLSMAGNNLTLQTDTDLAINHMLTGTGTLSILQGSVSTSMGIGDGQAGTLLIDSTELANIINGWALLAFGRTDGSGDLNVGAATWVDPLRLRTGSGALNINGTQTMGGNALTITSDGDLAINANLVGTGVLSITGSQNATSMGIGTGQAGALSLDDSELSRIVNGWTDLVFGTTSMTGAMNIGARTWLDRLSFRTSSGLMSVNGAQSMAGNNLTFQTDSNIAINGTLTGTGTLLFNVTNNSTTIGIGDGQVGTMHLSDAELDNINDGWGSITFGNTSMTGAFNIGARSWVDSVVFTNASGLMSVNGQQTTNSNMTFRTNSNLAINANLVGTGNLNIYGASNSTTMGVGDGEAGALHISSVELGRIIDGWNSQIFGSTSMSGAMNIAGRTWNDSVEFRTSGGALNINGAQDVGSNNLTIRTNTNLSIGQTLTGTGTINIMPSGNTSMGIGTGQAGTLSLTDAELAYIADGWSTIILGNTSTTAEINIGARTWNDSVDFRSGTGVITINGEQNLGSNDLTIRSNGNPVINAALTGTGTITLLPSSTTTSIALGTGQSGTFSFNNAELAQITDGWSSIVVGSTSITGTMNVGALTWNDNLSLITSTGAMNINGVQTMGANDLSLTTRSNLAINANLTGTGRLTITPSASNTTVGLGTGQSGTLNLTDTELNRIVNGWSDIVIGRTDGTGTVSVGAYTWQDNLTLQSGSGTISINGAQNVGANDLIIRTNGNLAVNANLAGTGNLTIRTSSGLTTIGVGDSQTGTLNLTNAELNRIVDGWNQVTFGSTASSGVISIGAYTWQDKVSFVTQGNVILNGAQATTETSGTTLVYATTNGAFINNAGAAAIDPGSGRYLVYSVDVANDTLGGISPPMVLLNQSYAAYGPDVVAEMGSIHLYSGAAARILYLVIDDVDKAYGYNVPTLTYTYVTGLQDADTLEDVITSYSLTAVGSSVFDNAGTTRTITGSFVADLGYTVVFTEGTLTVVKAEILVTVGSENRVYGDANPTFTASYTGFRNGEDESDIDTLANITTVATELSDVGSYAIVAQDADDNNYDFIYADGTLSITKATLNAAVQASTREYGDTNPTFAINYTGFRNGDNASVIDTLATGNTAATATSNVGVYAVTASGAFDNNYNFTYTGNNMTVTRATLTVTPDDVARAYGDTNPPLSVSYSGFKNGETAAVIDTGAVATTTADGLSNVGTYSITASGAADNNYNFVYNTGTLNVTKAMLTATAGNGTREYGLTNPAIGITYTGFRNGETQAVIDTLATAGSAANATSNVGTYSTTASGAFDNNYDFTYVDGVLNITKAMLTATAGDATREYGLANPAIGITYTGFRNGETQAVIDTLAMAGSAANVTSNVGTYATTASGGFDNNYDFTYVDGVLNITKAMLTATAGNGTREYGLANPTVTVSYSGFRNGETEAVIDTLATVGSAANLTSNVGTYSTTASGGFDNNYDFTYVDGALSVTKAMLTATAGNGTREYGLANPTITVSYSGFRNGETEAVIDTLATAGSAANLTSNVGTYSTTVSGGFDNNYDFTYVDGVLDVTKAMLTATAGDVMREYGVSNPVISVTYTGFRNGETQGVIDTLATAGSAASAASNVGTYATTASGAFDNNYDFTYAPGTLTVTRAPLTVLADDAERKIGEPEPVLGVSYSGFRNGENASVLTMGAVASTSVNSASPEGTYAITVSGGLADNYTFIYIDGVFTVRPADYVPPVLNNSVLPSTVNNSVSSNPSQAGIAVYGVLAPSPVSGDSLPTRGAQPITIVSVNTDYIGAWRNNPYLIAVTDDLQAFFLLQGFMPSSGDGEKYERSWY